MGTSGTACGRQVKMQLAKHHVQLRLWPTHLERVFPLVPTSDLELHVLPAPRGVFFLELLVLKEVSIIYASGQYASGQYDMLHVCRFLVYSREPAEVADIVPESLCNRT